jgi:hypothetical protein
MSESQIVEHCEGLAAFLFNEGLFYSNYTITEANELLNKTCLPTALKRLLSENETIVLEILKYYDEK